MIDDISYGAYLPHMKSVWSGLRAEVHSYMGYGRFYPVKYLMNILKWRFLPLSPGIFHAFNFTVLLASLAMASIAALPKTVRSASLILFCIGTGFLQRPLLDAIALNTIGESWVILFLAIGLAFYPARAGLYRLFFLLAALSKEPAVVAFAASAAVHGMRKDRKACMIDGALFVGLLLAIKYIQSHGSYLASYSFLSRSAAVGFAMGAMKCLIGIVPLLIPYVWNAVLRRSGKVPAEDAQLAVWAGIFAVLYIALVAPRGTAGYLLMPAAFALYVAAVRIGVRSLLDARVTRPLVVVFGLCWCACLALSTYRYWIFTRSINEPSRRFNELIDVRHPRLILLNGEEAIIQGRKLVQSKGTPVAVQNVLGGEMWAAKAPGDTVVLEFSKYFSPIEAGQLSRIEAAAGGWSKIDAEKTYRVLYAKRGMPQ